MPPYLVPSIFESLLVEPFNIESEAKEVCCAMYQQGMEGLSEGKSP